MTKIQFNNHGVPLMAYGDKTFVTTTGAPKPSAKNNGVEKRLDASKSIVYIDDITSVNE